MAEPLNVLAQEAIALALQDGVVLDSSTLIDRVMAQGYRYRPYVYGIVSRAYLTGMIEGVGEGRPRRYRLAAGWTIDEEALQAAKKHRGRMHRVSGDVPDPAPAPPAPVPSEFCRAMSSGPVFSAAPLVPAIGLVCQTLEERDGELPPHLGGRIADSLHRRFDEMFRGVE